MREDDSIPREMAFMEMNDSNYSARIKKAEEMFLTALDTYGWLQTPINKREVMEAIYALIEIISPQEATNFKTLRMERTAEKLNRIVDDEKRKSVEYVRSVLEEFSPEYKVCGELCGNDEMICIKEKDHKGPHGDEEE